MFTTAKEDNTQHYVFYLTLFSLNFFVLVQIFGSHYKVSTENPERRFIEFNEIQQRWEAR